MAFLMILGVSMLLLLLPTMYMPALQHTLQLSKLQLCASLALLNSSIVRHLVPPSHCPSSSPLAVPSHCSSRQTTRRQQQ
jgi:hypothetical protein